MAAVFFGSNPDDVAYKRDSELQATLKRLRAKSGSCRCLKNTFPIYSIVIYATAVNLTSLCSPLSVHTTLSKMAASQEKISVYSLSGKSSHHTMYLASQGTTNQKPLY